MNEKKKETKSDKTKAPATKVQAKKKVSAEKKVDVAAKENKKTSVKEEKKVAVKENKKNFVKEEKKGPSKGNKRAEGRPQRRQQALRKRQELASTGLEERVVSVNRVAKVVKGGRRFSFSALIIVGDKNGKVGYGLGKAKEVPEAIKKAIQTAQRRMVTVPIENGTIPHRIMGYYNAGKILFLPASEGTGVKAAGACRSILELAGIRNVLTKSLRGNNPHNIVKATFHALRKMRSVEQVAKLRNLDAKNVRLR